MLFTSGNYMVFLAVVFFAYWLLATLRRRRVPVLFILAVSYYFYALWNPKALVILFVISTVDFLTARFIAASHSHARRKLLLWLSILTDIGALAVFKYFNFFSVSLAEGLNKFGLRTTPLVLQIIAPLGLSFITFRSLSYVIDVYRKAMPPTRRYFDYLAFVAFFPTVIAGPVVRAKELLPQFQERAHLTSEEGTHAIFLIVLGLIKKIAIANFLSDNLVGRVFEQPQLYSSVETLAAVYGFALQIYCDFSGYSDIAIGSALLLGFRLPINFNSPYRAVSLPDFWKRWHITLSNWLTDYVYFSIGGLRKRPFNLYRNVVLTMLIGGLWHGAAWAYIIWGGLHGLGLAVNRWWENRRRRLKRKPRQQWWVKALCVLATFHFVCLTWIFFWVGLRSASLSQAWEIVKRIGALQPGAGNLATPVLTVLALGYLSHWLPKDAFDRVRGGWNWLPSPVQAALILSIAVGLYYLSGTEAQFIYGNF
ncbi:MAG TPA: MBOAT family O-acyltransferase [Pyrinomonadaceae bacterium]